MYGREIKMISMKGRMWQSQVVNEHYSVAYFNCIHAFKALYLSTSIESGAHIHCVSM